MPDIFMYLASEVTAERHLPCEAISRYCPPAVSLDQGEGTLAKLFVVRAPIQFPKKGPSPNGDEPGPRGYLRRARGRRENLALATMFLRDGLLAPVAVLEPATH